MDDTTRKDVSRRDFIRLGVTITTGLAVPPLLSACLSDTYDPPEETFVEPMTLQSVNGVLDITLTLAYLTTTLFNPTTGKDQTVTLRNMFGTIPAPTLRVNVGDLLRIKVVNNFPPNPPDPNPTRHLRYHNSTNLHTHGLHVYPDIYPQPATPPYTSPNTTNPPLLYGDFVVDDPEQGIKPGETRQYEYRLRDDHPAGHVLVSPAPARLERHAGRQRHGRRAASSKARSTTCPKSPRRRSACSCSRRRSTTVPASSKASRTSRASPTTSRRS